jgi:hypothetical protein
MRFFNRSEIICKHGRQTCMLAGMFVVKSDHRNDGQNCKANNAERYDYNVERITRHI